MNGATIQNTPAAAAPFPSSSVSHVQPRDFPCVLHNYLWGKRAASVTVSSLFFPPFFASSLSLFFRGSFLQEERTNERMNEFRARGQISSTAEAQSIHGTCLLCLRLQSSTDVTVSGFARQRIRTDVTWTTILEETALELDQFGNWEF